MRYELKDYQQEAVGDVLRNLAEAREDWHRKRRPVHFSLTATTGAGKTVMAAAAIEALFDGDDEFDFEADPGAVVLWFTDDPALNEQTRFRLLEAGDRIQRSRLKVIENTFNEEKLSPGHVYFLNAQKLSKNGLLVRGADSGRLFEPGSADEEGRLFDSGASPDLRAFTIWDTIRNTVEDEHLTLYLILDEAHRGMRTRNQNERENERAEKQTIVRRLINGAHGSPAVPVVWGISATVKRFNDAMAEAEGRFAYPQVTVDPARVQQSGLIKDDIRLEFPTEIGLFDTVLLARAVRKVREATDLWRAYAATQEAAEDLVVPLLVVQMPNTPSDELLSTALATIHDEWPDLPGEAIAHVFGDHTALQIGESIVPYVSPEKVQDRTGIRVLLAKDAISTGWDCPRAEVLVSFRPHGDRNHITQLLGRMVRAPLARRVPGDDRLNSVECVLPHFNRSTATAVAEILVGRGDADDAGADGTGDSGGGEGRRVLIAPVDMEVNSHVPESVWEAFDRLPSQSLPRKVAKPLKRLSALAQALSRDGLRTDARKDAYDELVAVLDGLLTRHKAKVEEAAYGIMEVEGEIIRARMHGHEGVEVQTFSEVADDRAVAADFKAAGRVITADLARRFADHIAVETDDDDGLFDAHVKVAALTQIDGVRDELERAADTLATIWMTEHRVAIKGLSDERRAVYDDIVAMSTEPQRIDVLRPHVRAEETKGADGETLPTRPLHLMSAPDGAFPVAQLNEWERGVLEAEMARDDFLAWYRNPSRASPDSLSVAYTDGKGAWRRMCPDFLFFHGADSDVKVSIVDPHSYHLADALPKLRGLAAFAATYGDELHRVEAIARVKDGSLRVLDMQSESVRAAVEAAEDAESLYLSGAATTY